MAAWRHTHNPPVGIFDVVDPEADAALALARAAGLRVGVISNSNGTVRALLGALGLARHLDFVIDSFEVGVEKPDARIFALALEQAGAFEEAAAAHRIGRFDLPWWPVGACLLLAVVTAVGAAWWPARAASRIPVTQALSMRPPRPRPHTARPSWPCCSSRPATSAFGRPAWRTSCSSSWESRAS